MMRLYIDPGTGSMLFAIIIGLIGVVIYYFKGLIVKAQFFLSGGKASKEEKDVTPLVIFSDDKRYWPVFEPIVRELDKREFDVVYMTSSPDDPALSCTEYPHLSARFIGEGNRAFAKLNFLHATIVLSTTPGLDVLQWKRSKYVQFYIHIPHSPAELTTYRPYGTDYFDAMLLAGQFQVDDARDLEKIRNLPSKDLVLTGSPFLDEKARRLAERSASDTASSSGETSDRTVLLAPSWGPSSILNRYGADFIRDLLATGYHVIVRPHPQSFTSEKKLIDDLASEFPENEQLEWNRDTDNFEVLYRSDILISDFSGVIFEYALVFDKPVICADTEFDPAPYDVWWLKRLPWGISAIPRTGKKLTTENRGELKKLIDDCLEDRSYSETRNQLRDEAWIHRGEGAVRMADYIINRYNELTSAPRRENRRKK